MAVAFKTALGNNFNNVSGTTLAITTTAAIAVDDLVVVRWAADNLSATTPTATCSDGSNTYTVIRQAAVNATAASGVAGGMLVTKATVAKASGSTITLTLSGAVAGKAAYAESFGGAEATVRTAAVGTTGTTAASTITTGSATSGDLVLGFCAIESRAAVTADSDTSNGSWSTQVLINGGGTSGQDATSVQIAGQYKVVTATATQTYNLTGTATEWVNGCVPLQASPEPVITQAAYQFFDDAGTESGAASLAAQNTAVTGNLDNGDGFGMVRVRLQSTTSQSVPSTDDFMLQWEKNASGSWTNATSGAVVGYDNPNLTESAATTNRLTGGTGTFTAGKVSEISHATNVGWSGNNYTEILYSVRIVAAQVASGDTLRFRVVRNTSTANMTYTATPTINILFSVITQAAYQFFADGTETGSVSLAAQSTGPTVDVGAGDVNAQLRMRLQATNAAGPAVTDDWQLQYLKTPGVTLIDSYPGSNQDAFLALTTGATAAAQSFLGGGQLLTRAGFYLQKVGTPNGNVTAALYASAGTYGATDNVPTGTALATSTTTTASTSLSTSYTMTYFDFDGTFTLTNGTPYFIAVSTTNTGNSSNCPDVGYDSSSSTHGGTYAAFLSGAWGNQFGPDLCFEVYGPGAWTNVGGTVVAAYNSANLTDAAATTNRLTGGTGTFTAGKISETGLVSDLGWAGNNYTELLYSLTFKQAALTNGDVVTFRALRNAAPEAIADSYPAAEQENYSVMGNGSFDGYGQTFTGNGRLLSRVTFWLSRVLNPSGPIVARLYAHTGTFGAGGTGTGSPLAISTNSVASSSVLTKADSTFPLYPTDFTFDGTYTLVNGTNYAIIAYAPGIGDASNYIRLAVDQAAPTHPGNRVSLSTAAAFGGNSAVDATFIVYTSAITYSQTPTVTIGAAAGPVITQAGYQFFDEVGTEAGAVALTTQNTPFLANIANGDGYGHMRFLLQSTTAFDIPATDDFTLQWEKNASGTWTNVGTGAAMGFNSVSLTEGQATTNRLTGGTGTFAAGKVSEDGVVEDVGWTGNNFTELLFSVQLMSGQLAVNDVLRFRVVRNGSTSGFTYTQVPAITILNLLPVIPIMATGAAP